MSDFRVPLPGRRDGDFVAELDWDEARSRWTASEREMYGAIRWFEGLSATNRQLHNLITFFRIQEGSLSYERLCSLSPGDLAMLHAQSAHPPTVLAGLCATCERHWLVFRYDDSADNWSIFGRTCEFAWYRGSTPEGDALVLLTLLRRDAHVKSIPG